MNNLNTRSKVYVLVERHCYPCIIQACYRMIGALQDLKIYDEPTAQHNRQIFVEMSERFDDGMAVRNKITEFFWGLPENLAKPVHRLAMLATIGKTLTASGDLCLQGIHARSDTTVWFDASDMQRGGKLVLKNGKIVG